MDKIWNEDFCSWSVLDTVLTEYDICGCQVPTVIFFLSTITSFHKHCEAQETKKKIILINK